MYWNTLRLRQKPLKFVSDNSIDNELSGGTWADDQIHIYVSLGLNSFIYFLVYFNLSLVVFNICRFLMNDLQYTCGSFILELTWKSILWYMKLYTKTCPCKWYVIGYVMMTSSNGTIFRVIGPFVRGMHRTPMNSPHKGQWRGALVFSFICAWINSWENNREAGDLRRHRAHYDFIVMLAWQDNISYYMKTLLPKAGISGRDE